MLLESKIVERVKHACWLRKNVFIVKYAYLDFTNENVFVVAMMGT